MLVANSFDLWQRDAFFSAAEEVQHSADILESAYRTWVKQKKEGLVSSDLEELRRELQTALGTAKWQLEEFERAVRLSYRSCRDQNRMARHQQFVVAIESQISRIEDTLRVSLDEDGKKTIRWVNLNKDERDDLAMFISGSSGPTTAESTRHESQNPCISSEKENLFKKKDLKHATCSSSSSSSFSSNMDATSIKSSLGNDATINVVVESVPREARGNVKTIAEEETSCGKGTWLTPKSALLKIAIPGKNGEMRMLSTTVEDTPKGNGLRTSSCLHLRGINYINKVKLFRCSSSWNNRMLSPRRSQLRLVIVLMLSFFLLVPYFLRLS